MRFLATAVSPAARRLEQIERIELLLARRRDGEIAVAPAVRRPKHLVQGLLVPAIDRPISPRLAHDLAEIARIEDQRIFARQAVAPVTTELHAEGAALEGVHTFEGDHQVKPQDRRERRGGPAQPVGGDPAEDGADVIGRVIGLPGVAVGVFPFRIRHLRMATDAMIEIVFVEIGIHPRALLQQHLVILGAGQRREEEEFENIDRQFPLDDLDVAQDRFLGVAGEAQNVAGVGDGAVLAPLLQHVAVFGDLVLALLGREQIVGIDVLKSDEDPPHAGRRRLLDEIGDAMAERVDLDGETDLQSLARVARSAGRTAFPIAVAGEIVVGDEEAIDALARSSRGRAASRSSAERKRLLRPCTLMMVQKEH